MENNEIVIRIKKWRESNDEYAIFELYHALNPYFKHLSNKIFAYGLDTDSIINEVFYKAINKYDVNSSTKFITFFYHIFRNRCLSYRRYNKVRPMIPSTGELTYEEASEKEKIGWSERKDLQLLLTKLTKKQRQVIQLYLEGYSKIEISKELNTLKSNVSNLFKNAIINLREIANGN